ncbi:zinc ABC transporter substrate-binding protein [uncultured Clostridium sp.]|uniref:metal ABC transporter substrate-binding protein n=1 Tax=uncultured Clostridium sp. TaxID=59620 RepID=UPI002630286E|nr:zinc ABC transporter substrate-binding protein [uncultured Clostridium sp.]
MKKLTFIMLIVTGVFFLGLGGIAKPLLADTTDVNHAERGVYLNIMASNKSEYYMLNALTKGEHNIEYMFSNEKNNEEYKPTEEAEENVSNMNLFFYAGNNYEPWANEFISNLNRNEVGVIDLSRGIGSKQYTIDGNKKGNPYYWTGPNEYQIILYNAKSALQEKDPANRSFYEENYNDMIKSMNETLSGFNKVQSKCKNKPVFLTRNNDFEYLLSDLGINYIVVPENISFNDYMEQNNLKEKNIFVIQNSTDKEAVKGIPVIKLQLENENMGYLELLQNNINNLENAYK